MEARFNVIKEERKALVTAFGEMMGVKPEYQGAPSFAFAVGGCIIDKIGTITFDEQMNAEEVRTLLTELAARGFTFEGDIDELAPVAPAPEAEPDAPAPVDDGETPQDSESAGETSVVGVSAIETPDLLVIEVPLAGFTRTALDNLEKMVASKWELILKAIGVPESDDGTDLPIEQTESTLRFPWFPLPASKEAIEAYTRFVFALCEMAKKQKRVTMKDADVESEKFAMRCFLLRLGFIGDEYKSARKILLSKLSGSGSFKSGTHKKSVAPAAVTAADSGGENPQAINVCEDVNDANNAATGGETAPRLRCDQCRQHCYYTDGVMRTNEGAVVDTSKRTPNTYTHYCLGTPSGFRRIKHATEWSGLEMASTWCPLNNGVKSGINVCEGDTGTDNTVTGVAAGANDLAEALADAELIHDVNRSFEDGGNYAE